MYYYRFHCSNGYCGCGEDYYEKSEEELTDGDLWVILADYLSAYSFLDPDERFVDNLEDEEEVQDYYDRINEYSYFNEVSEKEYLKNANDE